jgi:hypothetical protein
MFEAISNLANTNQVNPQTADVERDAAQGSTQDVAEGKVNPVESLPSSAEESDLSPETDSDDVIRRDSDEGRIVDLVG